MRDSSVCFDSPFRVTQEVTSVRDGCRADVLTGRAEILLL